MSLAFSYPVGATPIDQDQISGLIPKHILFQHELNEWEASNILQAKLWLNSYGRYNDIYSLSFIVELHKKMFDQTWTWAGKLRKSQTNIGVEASLIVSEIGLLLGDMLFWLENKTYNLDECCARLHHRLVAIHPFPNGNGRLSRLYADLSLARLGLPPFSWGTKDLNNSTKERQEYIVALKSADHNNYAPLLEFVRR